MSTEANEAKSAAEAAAPKPVAKEAPTEQQKSEPGVPRRFLPGQTVCNEKNEKGKLCNGHLKQVSTQQASLVHLRGDDALHKCQTCGALYTGPPQGHVRDTRKQERFVERELAAILQAAGGTLPAYDYPTGSQHAPVATRRAVKPAPAAATTAAATKPAAAAEAKTPAPAGETPEQKKARLIAEHKAKLAAKQAGATPPAAAADQPAPAADAPTPAPSPTSGTDSSSAADSHRPAAEAQAATGQASAAPMSPAASTASPAAGAETVADLAPDASTELTPGAPKNK